MPDIFISYSRKDIEQATTLADALRARGFEVWIDVNGIEAAASWGAVIAHALESCSAYVILLSANSLESQNVAKELSIAAKLAKKIVPVRLERVVLKGDFLYHLTSIQHVYSTDVDAIVRAIELAGAETDVSFADTIPIDPNEIRLAVLPFEDQSPAHDNEWFSDGLTDELISTLGKLGLLFVVDSQSSRIYKNAKLTTKEIASQLAVRYIVRGAVRKAAEKIRVQATLVDAPSGATLYDERFSGTMDDIFEIQERTAFDIAKGLKLKLTKDEIAEIEDRGTDNAEAYELYLKAVADVGEAKEDFARSMELIKRAVMLDPNFSKAYALMAVRYANYFRAHGRKQETLELQRQATERALALAPEHLTTYNALANLYNITGENEKAIEMAQKMVIANPKSPYGYAVAGFMHVEAGKIAEAAKFFEQALVINPSMLRELGNLSACYYHLGDREALKKTVIRSVPYLEQYLALHPGDQTIRVQLMVALESIGKHDLANREADRLIAMAEVFGNTYYQIASIYGKQSMTEKAVELLYKAAGKGYVNFDELRNDKEWFASVQALPNFSELVAELETMIAKTSEP
ncbi:MAG TPA: TIR domain-containing protein [Candidatus Kapabacteria bacterium]|nr:TIR domain-containing protein [Candidatus Kapabacteria bacterium]